MLYEQNNKHGLDEYILSNVQCLYGKNRRDAYTLGNVQCLYSKHMRDTYTLSRVQCLYGKHRCDALYIKPSAMLIYEAQSVMY